MEDCSTGICYQRKGLGASGAWGMTWMFACILVREAPEFNHKDTKGTKAGGREGLRKDRTGLRFQSSKKSGRKIEERKMIGMNNQKLLREHRRIEMLVLGGPRDWEGTRREHHPLISDCARTSITYDTQGRGIRSQFPRSRKMKPIFSVSQMRTPDTPIRLTWPERRILFVRYIPIFLLLGILLVEEILLGGWLHRVRSVGVIPYCVFFFQASCSLS
jgi:hypothetical protein